VFVLAGCARFQAQPQVLHPVHLIGTKLNKQAHYAPSTAPRALIQEREQETKMPNMDMAAETFSCKHATKYYGIGVLGTSDAVLRT
jgi:hypothetical protein